MCLVVFSFQIIIFEVNKKEKVVILQSIHQMDAWPGYLLFTHPNGINKSKIKLKITNTH